MAVASVAEQVYVETDCTFEHDGQVYESGGAYVSPVYAIGYLGREDGRLVLTSWKGIRLGTARIVATWRTPGSYVSSHYHQVEATINGAIYTGRSAGEGMIWKGRAKAGKAVS